MPSFQYKAKRKDAQTVAGQIIAQDKDDAIERINQLGLVPIKVEEAAPAGAKFSGVRAGLGKAQMLTRFSRQLVSLLKGGVPILRALEIISRQQKNAEYRHLIESIHLNLREGKSFSDTLSEYPRVFPPFYTAMVKAGEESGTLKETVSDLAAYFKTRGEMAAKIQNAMIYPALMAVLGCGSVVFVLTYVLPKLTVLYDQFGQALPVPTRVVMRISDFFVHDWAWVGLAVFLVLGAVTRMRRSARVRFWSARTILQLPAVGPFFLKVEMMRFFRTLELLLRSGVPIVRAVHLAVPVVHNEKIRGELGECREQLMTGRSFAESLKEIASMPDTVATLIAVGEESGNITESLHDIADNYRQETEEAIKVMTTLLEPLLIILVGSVIGFIVIAMLLPIFSLDMMVS